MKRYKFKAKDENGKLVTGEVEAATIQQAVKLLRQKNLFVISLSEDRFLSISFFKSITERVSLNDVTTFTRQLSTMINAGLPITEALLILRNQSKGAFQKVVAKILSDVEEGSSLSASMEKHPHAFTKTYVALIKSGELGGVLDEVLSKLAEDMEKQQEFRGKVKGALVYPVIVIVGMLIVAFIMIVFVVPRLTSIYDQVSVELPMSTKFLISFSDIMVKIWPLVLLLVGAVLYMFKLYVDTKDGRRKFDEFVFKLPLIGPLKKQIILTELTRTLSLMVGSGVSILEGITISSQVVGNSIMSEALVDTAKMVEKGFPLAFAFSKHPEAFPFILSQMIAVGEETGKMDEVLRKVSHVFEVESEQKVKALTAAIEPAILIVLGIGVAFLVISILLPIYNLTTQL